MNRFFSHAYLSVIYLFLYIPIVIVVWFSFNNSAHSLIWHGFTWHWYGVLFQDRDLLNTAWHSLILGISAASIATLLGTLAAVSLYRYRFTGKKLMHLLIFTLIILPDIVMGIALLLLFSSTNFPLGFYSLLLAHITLCLPFAAVTVSARLGSLDKYLVEASRDLGASEITIFKRILIPLLLPSLLAAWLLSFTLSLDDVIISYFVSGPNFQILPLKIYAMVKVGVKPEVNALSTLLLALTFVIVFVSQALLRKKK